jgi:hypothetical protein
MQQELTTDQVREMRAQAEEKITSILNELERQTALEIHSIGLEIEEMESHVGVYRNMRAKVKMTI